MPRERRNFSGAEKMAILDMTAEPAYAPEIVYPEVYPIETEDLGMSIEELMHLMDESFVVDENPAVMKTPGRIDSPGRVTGTVVSAEIRSCPERFDPYEVKKDDTCWCLWRIRTDKSVRWPQARKQCKETCESGDADKLKVGEVICAPN